MSEAKIQLRGHCQCCGREQAVVQGRMAKHGYTVEEGWFRGVCQGNQYRPIEQDRHVLDRVVSEINADCAKLEQQIARLESGQEHPSHVETGERVMNRVTARFEKVSVYWDAAGKLEQERAVETLVWRLKSRIGAGRSHTRMLVVLAAELHGKPLQEVKREDGPEPILNGDKRKLVLNLKQPRVVTATSVHGGKVAFTCEHGYSGRISTRAWRLLEKAA